MWGTQRIAAVIVGGVGIIGLGVGAAMAVSAKSQYNDSLAGCLPSDPDQCGANGLSQRNSAISAGNVATASLLIGGAAVAGGVVLWLTAPPGHARETQSASIALVPSLGGGALRTTW